MELKTPVEWKNAEDVGIIKRDHDGIPDLPLCYRFEFIPYLEEKTFNHKHWMLSRSGETAVPVGD